MSIEACMRGRSTEYKDSNLKKISELDSKSNQQQVSLYLSERSSLYRVQKLQAKTFGYIHEPRCKCGKWERKQQQCGNSVVRRRGEKVLAGSLTIDD